jgi:hypothetical protein
VELLPVSAHQRNLRHLAVISNLKFPVPNSVFGNSGCFTQLKKSGPMCPRRFGVVPVQASSGTKLPSPYANYEYVKGESRRRSRRRRHLTRVPQARGTPSDTVSDAFPSPSTSIVGAVAAPLVPWCFMPFLRKGLYCICFRGLC